MDRIDPQERLRQHQAQVAAEKHAAALRAVDLRTLMSDRMFRRFVYAELAACGLNADVTDTNSTNQNYFNAGRRSYAVNLARELEAVDQGAFLTMLREAMEDRRSPEEKK